MDLEFHYWVTGLTAEYAGFSAADCRIIAYSSQYVDDNTREIHIFDDEFDVFPSYVSHVTQTPIPTEAKDVVMRIYPLFHFLPGDMDVAASARVDHQSHSLVTTPNSAYAARIMELTMRNAFSRYMAKDKSCLHRIGIAAHCYADTWAHQNFAGWFHSLNMMPGHALVPNVGHADAGHAPDIIGNTWQDQRLVNSQINNTARFMEAASNLFQHFSSFCARANLSPRGEWSALEAFLESAWSEGDGSVRLQKYLKHSKFLKDYDSGAWEAGAFTKKMVSVEDGTYTEKCLWRTDIKKTNTDWLRFQEGVKGHLVDASSILRPALQEAGVHL